MAETASRMSFKTSYADALLEEENRRLFEEEKIMNLFENRRNHPRQLSEFDQAFGEDPLDFLMTPFGLPIYEAERNRPEIEKHGRPPTKYIPIPPEMTFEKVQQAVLQQCTERTCPEEHYFSRYLRENVRKALDYAFEEGEKRAIESDHRAFKLFSPLDYIAESLWRNNERHPERLQDSRTQEEIPLFKEIFEKFPREPPPLHLRYTVEQAAVVIQKRWRGTMTRRRPDIKTLRRHMAAAKVQYCDPFKLVEELWDREIPPSRLKAFEHSRPKEPPLPVLNAIRPKLLFPEPKNLPIPKYLAQIKAEVQKKIDDENNDPIKKDAAEKRRLERIENSDSETEEELKAKRDQAESPIHEDNVNSDPQQQPQDSKTNQPGKPGEGNKEQTTGTPTEMVAPSTKNSGAGKPLASFDSKDKTEAKKSKKAANAK